MEIQEAMNVVLKHVGGERISITEMLQMHQVLLALPTTSTKMRECIDHLENKIHAFILSM